MSEASRVQGNEWVIDTNVLIRACSPHDESDLDAQGLIQTIRQSHHIAVDHQGRIQAEYENNLRDAVVFRLWIDAMWKLNKIAFRDGRLPNRHRNHLLSELRFDDDDLSFVAVASRGISKLLVTEDSDYNEQVRDYLTEELSVEVLDTADAFAHAAGA